jgi:hypothetical protein
VKALTVRQPWATLIIAGLKDVENRSWTTSYRGRLAIHAGGTLDKEGLDEYADLVESLGELPRGAMIGAVVLADVTQGSKSPFAMAGQYHWLLRDPKAFAEPVPMAGRPGLWEWDG